MPTTVRSFAKINLGLHIGALRPDGFHELRTVYQTIALHDVIRVRVGKGQRDRNRVPGPQGSHRLQQHLLPDGRTGAGGAWGEWTSHRRNREEASSTGRTGRRFGQCGCHPTGIGARVEEAASRAGEAAHRGRSGIGFTSVSRRRHDSGHRAREKTSIRCQTCRPRPAWWRLRRLGCRRPRLLRIGICCRRRKGR